MWNVQMSKMTETWLYWLWNVIYPQIPTFYAICVLYYPQTPRTTVLSPLLQFSVQSEVFSGRAWRSFRDGELQGVWVTVECTLMWSVFLWCTVLIINIIMNSNCGRFCKTRSILTKVTRNIIAMHAGIAPDLITIKRLFHPPRRHCVKETTEATDLNQSNENH